MAAKHNKLEILDLPKYRRAKLLQSENCECREREKVKLYSCDYPIRHVVHCETVRYKKEGRKEVKMKSNGTTGRDRKQNQIIIPVVNSSMSPFCQANQKDWHFKTPGETRVQSTRPERIFSAATSAVSRLVVGIGRASGVGLNVNAGPAKRALGDPEGFDAAATGKARAKAAPIKEAGLPSPCWSCSRRFRGGLLVETVICVVLLNSGRFLWLGSRWCLRPWSAFAVVAAGCCSPTGVAALVDLRDCLGVLGFAGCGVLLDFDSFALPLPGFLNCLLCKGSLRPPATGSASK
jgi:hypothetical protein